MKTIQLIQPIQLTNRDGSPVEGITPTSFCEYVDTHLLNDKVFSGPFKSICAGLDIRTAFKKAEEEGGPILLDDATHFLLKSTIENPQQVAGPMLTPEAARQYLPFMRAIIEAE